MPKTVFLAILGPFNTLQMNLSNSLPLTFIEFFAATFRDAISGIAVELRSIRKHAKFLPLFFKVESIIATLR